MKLTARQISEMAGGKLVGDGEVIADHVASLQAAGEGAVTFAKREFLGEAAETRASVILLPEEVSGCSAVQIIVPNPYLAFAGILKHAEASQRDHPRGIHETAVIGENVEIGEGVGIGAHAVIGNGSRIGDRSAIYPNTTIGARCTIGCDAIIYANTAIREETMIGERSIIHSNCSIGGDGFGYLQIEGKHQKVPQVGRVIIGDDVEIGCNCTIDRATMDATRIGNGVKIDNHSHLAHNVEIGDGSMLIAYARIGGSTKVGKNVLLLEDVGLTNGISLGDGAIVGACAKVIRSWPAGSHLLGMPAQKVQDEKRQLIMQKKLPRFYERLQELEKRLEAIENRDQKTDPEA